MWQLSRLWARVWLLATGMPVTTSGSWPGGDQQYVVVANHVSYLDPIVLFATIPFCFRPLAKYEISKAPLFGFIYARVAILVDRSNAKKKAESVHQLSQAIHRGHSISIYPEGTFNESSEPTKTFYDGAFRLAIEHQIPVLPVLFPDTSRRWHFSHWWNIWPGKNRACVLEPIPTNGMTLDDVKELREHVRTQMDAGLLALTSE